MLASTTVLQGSDHWARAHRPLDSARSCRLRRAVLHARASALGDPGPTARSRGVARERRQRISRSSPTSRSPWTWRRGPAQRRGVGIQVFIAGGAETRSDPQHGRSLVRCGLPVGMPVMGVTAGRHQNGRDDKYFRSTVAYSRAARKSQRILRLRRLRDHTASCPVPM